MIDRMLVRCVWVALLAVLFSSAAYAEKKPSTSSAPSTTAPATPKSPAPVTPARPDSTALTAVVPSGVALTPGPLVPTGSPVKDRTTIAPFPIPWDTSRSARERARAMNVPRTGLTLAEPLLQDDSQARFIGPPSLYAPYQGKFYDLPEPLAGPAPEYPKAARDAGIHGTVIVMADVLVDGTVGEVRVAMSIRGLDEAAIQAVKRMRFKPASYKGRPIVAWVGVPVRFTLH